MRYNWAGDAWKIPIVILDWKYSKLCPPKPKSKNIFGNYLDFPLQLGKQEENSLNEAQPIRTYIDFFLKKKENFQNYYLRSNYNTKKLEN